MVEFSFDAHSWFDGCEHDYFYYDDDLKTMMMVTMMIIELSFESRSWLGRGELRLEPSTQRLGHQMVVGKLMMMMIRMMMMMTKVMMMIITMVVMTTAWCAQRIPPDAGGFGGASHPLASFLYQIFTFSPPSYSALLFSPILSIYYTTPAASVLPSQFSIHPTIRTVFAIMSIKRWKILNLSRWFRNWSDD